MESFRGATTSSRQGQVVAAALSGRVIVPPYPACQRPLSTNRRTTRESFGTLKNPLFLRLFGWGQEPVSMWISIPARKKVQNNFSGTAPSIVRCGPDRRDGGGQGGFCPPTGFHVPSPHLTGALIWSFGQASIDDHGPPQHGGGRFIESLGGAFGGCSGIPIKFCRPFCEGFARFCWGFPISGVQAVQIFGVSLKNHRKFALFEDDKLKRAGANIALRPCPPV